jgi:hypothetical protein
VIVVAPLAPLVIVVAQLAQVVVNLAKVACLVIIQPLVLAVNLAKQIAPIQDAQMDNLAKNLANLR